MNARIEPGVRTSAARTIEHLKVQIQQVNWFSSYRVHHRVTNIFAGRVFLLRMRRIHSPAGGRGANTGIGDAVIWPRLAAVLSDSAPDGLLDSYEAERIRCAASE
jgi:2-polyprenyl-6-methoxyphenol hydroxylase-like FAD-dependent oxidoreductase